jgi:hypothetical protein
VSEHAAAAFRVLEPFNQETAVEPPDGHRFTQIEREMGSSTGLKGVHLLGDP